MQDLTLVGLTEDKSKLVLVSDSGEEYTLPADARLRAALRGDHARLGQLEIQMESALRPRDIQARIRSGESPEAVADAAQTTVDRIMGYATPVLAERAHIAQRAQGSSVRRKAGEGPARTLGDAVAERLRARNVDPDSVEWDAWRREDGRWTLVADYRSGGSAHHAEFVFDAPGRYVVAEDDEARWLVGEQSPRQAPQPRAAQRRLSAVTQEDELPLGADAIGMVSDPEVHDAPADGDETVLADEPTVDLSQAAGAVRERTGKATPGAGEDTAGAATGDADWMATQASERVARPAAREPDRAPEQGVGSRATEAATETAADQVGASGHRTGDQDAGRVDGETSEPEQQPEAPAKKGKKRGRASVPSWDEIMFGGGRSE